MLNLHDITLYFKELLGEEEEKVEIPADISQEALARVFVDWFEQDFFDLLHDSYNFFINHFIEDWDDVRRRSLLLEADKRPALYSPEEINNA